jgi:hypothetical protein
VTRRNRRVDHIGLSVETIPGLDIQPTPVGLGVARVGARRPPQVATTLAGPPVYTAYNGRPAACHEGQRLYHEGRPEGHTTHARYRRKYRGEHTLMCGPCAHSWHAADGLTSPLPSTTRR